MFFFMSEIMYRATGFMVICFLPYVINIREFHELSAFHVQMAIKKLKRHKSSGIDQIQAELIKVGATSILSDITKLIKSIWKIRNIL